MRVRSTIALLGRERLMKCGARPSLALDRLRRLHDGRIAYRIIDVDMLVCPKCAGRLRTLGEVTDPAMVRLVLESLGTSAEVPCPARARDLTLIGNLDAN